MKDSHYRTPRTMDECNWTPGYQSYQSFDDRFKNAMKGLALAVAIGIVLAACMFFGLSK